MSEWLPIDIYEPEIDDYETSPIMKEVTRAGSSSVLFSIDIIR